MGSVDFWRRAISFVCILPSLRYPLVARAEGFTFPTEKADEFITGDLVNVSWNVVTSRMSLYEVCSSTTPLELNITNNYSYVWTATRDNYRESGCAFELEPLDQFGAPNPPNLTSGLFGVSKRYRDDPAPTSYNFADATNTMEPSSPAIYSLESYPSASSSSSSTFTPTSTSASSFPPSTSSSHSTSSLSSVSFAFASSPHSSKSSSSSSVSSPSPATTANPSNAAVDTPPPPNISTSTPEKAKKSELSTDQKEAIALGVPLGFLAICLAGALAIMCQHRWKKTTRREKQIALGPVMVEMVKDSSESCVIRSRTNLVELPAPSYGSEEMNVAGVWRISELMGTPRNEIQ
ncbi:hypothetical protein BO70DRAFT_352243 [Aspergillus heteromorphus CBS 117.55]|uniref:Uncharacterized protein n=1 Tax=Aspergillus heteromorphus CBS 117.55 TaxID=1448321 RepID=A0A317WB06_9EURO|nr:uncharacterized protein BO70DRAFT_352243 [Aspergillus heteromorphus CBS 117.55]PWY83379.1 hypothetical protein BO70DRAFT_352243 [Aspergillus heteromorphus CBS 117.55]